jgi:hypothetical protein
MVMSMLRELRYPGDIFKAVCARFDVTSVTVRNDLRWACKEVQKDMGAAFDGEPPRIYEYIDRLAEMTGMAGAAAPVMYQGQPLMGHDPETGEEFPVLQADAQLLGVSLKARQAQLAFIGYRDSIMMKKALAGKQLMLQEAKVELAKEQLRLAQQNREIDEERKALLASRATYGGMLLLQRPDQTVLERMARFLTLEKTELEEWVFQNTRQRGDADGGSDGDEDDAPGHDLQPPGESARLPAPDGERGGGNGDGSGSGNGSGGSG